jgi:hypothetical protein
MGDDDYEFSCSKEHHQRHRAIKLPRNHSKHCYIKEHLLKTNIVDGKQKSSISLIPTNPVVIYSLTKKGRWNLLDGFKNDIESFNFDDEIRISAIETRREIGHSSCSNVKAFHSVDKKGNPVHRFAAHSFANANTLMDKKAVLKSQFRVYPNSCDYETNVCPLVKFADEPNEHILYEIIQPCKSVSLFENERETLERSERRFKRLRKRQAVKFHERTTLKDIMKDNTEKYGYEIDSDANDEENDTNLVLDQTTRSQMSVDLMDLMKPRRGGTRAKKISREQSSDGSICSFEEISYDEINNL